MEKPGLKKKGLKRNEMESFFRYEDFNDPKLSGEYT
jgi:hypothetical protein